ncbi:hypothetical protein NBRC3222_2051 [Acetobacter pasteurianus NBRC 3222]|nr:hypothetical protein NBRC3222_2051 [Acetobacter pasteurianus NBRC 3222]
MRPRCAGVHILPLNHTQNLLKTYHSEFPKGLLLRTSVQMSSGSPKPRTDSGQSSRIFSVVAGHHRQVMIFHTRRRSVSGSYLVLRANQPARFGPNSILTASSLMRLFLLPGFRLKRRRIVFSHIFSFARREGTLPQFSTPRKRDKFYFHYYSNSWRIFWQKKCLQLSRETRNHHDPLALKPTTDGLLVSAQPPPTISILSILLSSCYTSTKNVA